MFVQVECGREGECRETCALAPSHERLLSPNLSVVAATQGVWAPPHPSATSRIIITVKPTIVAEVARSVRPRFCDSGISSSTTT